MKEKNGRPTKRPSVESMRGLGYLSFIVEDVRAILKKSRHRFPTRDDLMKSMKISVTKGKDGRPFIQSSFVKYSAPEMRDEDLALILRVLSCPQSIDATQKSKTKAEKYLQGEAIKDAIHWAKLFADAPGMMVDSLPKILKRMNKFVSSPLQAVVARYCLWHNVARLQGKTNDQFCERFWKENANVLADELSTELGVSVTSKTIDSARDALRTAPQFGFPRKRS